MLFTTVQQRQEPAIVRVTGDVDIAARHELHVAFQSVRDNPRIIVDLTGLSYIDSTAIEELFRAEKRAAELDGQLVIVARSQRLIRLLSIAGITGCAPIVETLRAALSLLGAH